LHAHNENVSSRAETYPEGVVQKPVDPLRSPIARGRRLAREFAFSVVIIGASTLGALALRPHVTATNLAMLYLLGVVAIAMRCRQLIAVIASFLSVAAFDFFCVPPYLTLQVSDYEYLLTFAGMLAVALVISTQTARIRLQATAAAGREARTETLYRLSRLLAGQTTVFDLGRAAAEYAEEVFFVRVVIFFPEDGKINFRRRSSDQLPIPRTEEAVAQWAFDHSENAGNGMKVMGSATAFYLPLKGAREMVGVMGVLRNGNRFGAEQVQLLEIFANQTALAIERTRSQHAAEAARIQMRTEQMRSSLLSGVSHDLRTPLASITGAATTLRSQGERLQPEVRQELLDSIADEAERLSRLVSNLVDMTRLESGVELRRDLCPLEEIVGAALQRVERQLGKRQVITHLPDSLPLVYVDDVLLGQVMINLLENVVKYTPEGTAIEVGAEATEDVVTLEVRDHGPGFAAGEEQRIFEKFYRGRSEGVRGVGLGLAICRAIVEAHRGTILGFNRAGGGAVFRIQLPLRGVR
jgi:two-component system, OmpR family, sensor histidine kinase KdpD